MNHSETQALRVRTSPKRSRVVAGTALAAALMAGALATPAGAIVICRNQVARVDTAVAQVQATTPGVVADFNPQPVPPGAVDGSL